MTINSLFSELSKVASIGLADLNVQPWKSYPPHNVYKEVLDNSVKYVIELAVAGFDKSELEVSKVRDCVYIKGTPSDDGDLNGTIVHRGLSHRAFSLKFNVANYVEISNTTLKNGLLIVELLYKLPEEEQARIYEIL
jgi:molecular chaperone IbpA